MKNKTTKKKKSRIKSQFHNCYKLRIYPTNEQEVILNNTLNECRKVYNKLLEGLKIQSFISQLKRYDKDGNEYIKYTTGSGFDLKRKPKKEGTDYEKLYNVLKRYFPDCVKSKINRGNTQKIVTYYINIMFPESKQFYFSVLQYENHKIFRQLSSLVSNAKNGKVGLMKFKGRDFFNSFTYNTQGFKFKDEGKRFGKLSLSKIGDIKLRVHRNVIGYVKNVIIKKEGSKWFTILTTCSNKKQKVRKIGKRRKKVVGLDMGLGSFVYDTNGKSWKRPKIFEEYEKDIARENRKLSRAKKGSKNRKKIKLILSNIYAKRTRAREDYLHKVSNYYATNYIEVVVEDLNIKEMVLKKRRKGKTMRAHILDASWAKFCDMLEYKLKERGGKLIRVNPKNTSKRCNKCGNIKKDLDLRDRVYKCEKCGYEINRDYNAAFNIRDIHTQELGSLEKSKDELVENDET